MSKRILCWVLTFIMVFSMMGGISFEAFGQVFDDIDTHWARLEIEEWAIKGLIKGYHDGTFKPNNNITRAEFITLINKALNIQIEEDISFEDVDGNEWYYKDLKKATYGEYISGYEDNMFKANNRITRQEVAVILQNLVQLEETEEDGLEQYNDTQNTPDWSKTALRLAVQKGYLTGYTDNTLKASNYITRAESIKVLKNLFGIVYNESGVYGPSVDEEVLEVKGNVTVSIENVTLKNMIIDGDLYLAEGIGEGDITLDNITVTGETIVKGGGINSIIIKNSSLANLLIIKKDGEIRLVAQGNTIINSTYLYSSAKLQGERLNVNSFGKVEIKKVAPGGTVEFEGNFSSIDVGASADIEVTGTSKIDELNIHKDIESVNLLVSPYSVIDKLNVNSEIDVINRGIILIASGDFARISRYDIKLPVNLQPRTSSGSSAPSTPKYNLSLSANPVDSGIVTGSGTYEEGKSVTITAIANDGYAFVEWKDGDNQITTSSSFNYTTTSENRTLTAYFETIWDFAGGSGTETDPYQVSNAEQLNEVRNHPDKHFIQTADIDLGVTPWNVGEGWEPIGSLSTPFEGVYDGNDFSIEGLYINRSDHPTGYYQGLFGYVNSESTLSNINLVGPFVHGYRYTGTLAGYNTGEISNCLSTNAEVLNEWDFAGGLVGYNSGIISDSSTTGIVKTDDFNAGGLVGTNYNEIRNCNSEANIAPISLSTDGYPYQLGGLVGYNSGGLIENSYATGNVTGWETVGGLVGENFNGSVINCYASGDIMGSEEYVGGLIGVNGSASIVKDSYATGTSNGIYCVGGLIGYNGSMIENSYHRTGTVSGSEKIGGLVGDNNGIITKSHAESNVSGSRYVGGLTGYSGYGEILLSYATGTVTASNETAGGLVGSVQNTTINDCYAMGNVSGGSELAGLAGYLSVGTTVTNCYSTGFVNGSSLIGGLIGAKSSSSTVTSSYWDTDSSGIETSADGIGYSTSAMIKSTNSVPIYTDWDFEDIWIIDEGSSYPYLQWQGSENIPYPPSPFAGGSGTETDPYQVSNAGQLNEVRNHLDKHFIQTADIDLTDSVTYGGIQYNGGEGWEPIGNQLDTFRGSYNGNEYIIINLYINRPFNGMDSGLFGYLDNSGVISSCSVSGIVNGYEQTGLLVGKNNGTIINSSTIGEVSGSNTVGGFVGSNLNFGVITGSYSEVKVNSTGITVGGFAGLNAGEIEGCHSKGDVQGIKLVGGLVGANTGNIDESFSSGNVSGDTTNSDTDSGGLVGVNSGSIYNSYSLGNVEGYRFVGGLVGRNSTISYDGNISNSYSTGTVTGTAGIGGLIGHNPGIVTSSYWDTDSSGITTSAGGTGYSTSEMHQQTTFIDWNFTDIWNIDEDSSYPYLRNNE